MVERGVDMAEVGNPHGEYAKGGQSIGMSGTIVFLLPDWIASRRRKGVSILECIREWHDDKRK